jgi:hypothetical protein
MDNKRLDREQDTRDDFQRPDSWKPASLLPEFKKVPGWAYRWIRTSVMNEADNLNVSSKMREGWEPVKLADHPEMKLMVDQNSRFKDGVEIGGLLLCKIPEEFVAQRKAYYAKQSQQQADAVDNSFMKQSDPRMPLFAESKATTSFGKGK